MDVDCDVLIIGCGPTGLVLASLLGGLGVRVAVLERDADVYPTPRATHIDEETLRNFQATGAMASLEVHTAPFGRVEDVAAAAYRACFDDEVVTVPGGLNQAAALASRAAPKWLLRRLTGVLGRRVL
mgnify:CR=1 FL=1